MADNDLIQRFEQVQDEARASWAYMEAVLRGDSIVFREGRGCKIWSTVLGIGFIVIFCLIVLFGLFPHLLSSLWVCAGVVIFFALAFREAAALATTQRIWLEILTNEREIVVCPEKESPRRLPLASIDCFVAHAPPGTDGHCDIIYGVCGDGRMPGLTPWLGAAGRLEANARLLGTICNLPVYFLERSAGACSFMRIRVDGSFELLDKDALVAASKVLYAPGQGEEA